MNERLKAFLWVLLRDHVAFGVAEKILAKHEAVGNRGFEYDDQNLEAYVDSLVKRLEPK
jgi:hypothetical protein